MNKITTFEMTKGNNSKEKGVFLSLNGPSILDKKVMLDVTTFIVNNVNKDYFTSRQNLEVKFDDVASYTNSLINFYDLDEDSAEEVLLEVVMVRDSGVIKPLNMFTTLLLYGFHVRKDVVRDCVITIVEGYGTFRFTGSRVSFAPETSVKEITINTTIQKDEF